MTKKKDELTCQNCAANLKFKAGTTALVCEYCGTKNEIPADVEEIEELDYEEAISEDLNKEEMLEIVVVKCNACAAEVTLKPNVTSDECPFCGTSLVVANKQSTKIIKPKSLLPFKVTKKEAQEEFKKWLGSLWFAPSKVAQFARNEEGLQGVYLPFWTFDFDTFTDYSGQRGDNYYVTETYTEYENGSPVTRTRQVTKTSWHNVSGHVENGFDDVLVVATKSLPKNILEKLEPWDLTSLLAYKDDYLSGFRAESYQVKLEEGLESAKSIVYEDICAAIKDDIGGDHQSISSSSINYDAVTFKHILLPVWVSAYRYQDKVYKFIVNAQTGEVQGERPVSYTKIIALVVSIILVLIIIISLASKGSHKNQNTNSIAPTNSINTQYNPNSYNNTRPNTYHRQNSTLNTINNTINAVGTGTHIYNSIKNSKPSSYQKQGKSYKVYNSANQTKTFSKKSSSSSSSSSRRSSSSSSSSRKRR